MLGQDMAYNRVPYFCTDQYELSMEYSGHVEPDGYGHRWGRVQLSEVRRYAKKVGEPAKA